MKPIAMLSAGLIVAACASTPNDAEIPITDDKLDQRIDEQFLKIDFNDDGIATPYEMKEYGKAQFAKFHDTDGDGVLVISCSAENFSKLITRYGPLHPSITSCHQTSAETAIEFTFEDYYAASASWRASVDQNSDGFISRAEYAASFMQK